MDEYAINAWKLEEKPKDEPEENPFEFNWLEEYEKEERKSKP